MPAHARISVGLGFCASARPVCRHAKAPSAPAARMVFISLNLPASGPGPASRECSGGGRGRTVQRCPPLPLVQGRGADPPDANASAGSAAAGSCLAYPTLVFSLRDSSIAIAVRVLEVVGQQRIGGCLVGGDEALAAAERREI